MQINVTPVRRNLNFHLPKDKITRWNGSGPNFTQFLNTLSIFFPEGERFFIDSVRNYRDRVEDPELKEQVKAFIGQEGFHSREHIDYNRALADAGFPVDFYEGVVSRLLNFIKRTAPASAQLSATIALEHLTAILANGLLQNPEVLAGSEERYTSMWQWHALEETEHKAVAYDVYELAVGKGAGAYITRVSGFVVANIIFWSLVLPYHLDILRRDKQLSNLKGWRQSLQNLWGKPGILRKIIPEWLDYFRPGFHPWDHDNREFLNQVDALADKVSGYMPVPPVEDKSSAAMQAA